MPFLPINFNVHDRKEVMLPKHIQYIYEIRVNDYDTTGLSILYVRVVKKEVPTQIINEYIIFPQHWKERNHKALHRIGNPNRNSGYKKIYHYIIPVDKNNNKKNIYKAVRKWDKRH